MGKIRGTHSAPGVYDKITDLSYAAKSLGITSLGLVGETLMGPAFEVMPVSSWTQYQEIFGGRSAEKFKDSKYPKYELPYIAKSYLSASDQLFVCRVLGLSGYNAGPAFIIKALDTDNKEHVIAVLRSRGQYHKYANNGDRCNPNPVYDNLEFYCDEVSISAYQATYLDPSCEGVTVASGSSSLAVSSSNYGRFMLTAKKNGTEVGSYQVSLNPGDKNYIYNVLGSDPLEGNAKLFVEELYDVMHMENVDEGKFTSISSGVTTKHELEFNDGDNKIGAVCDPVNDFVTVSIDNLKRAMLGKTYLCETAGNLTSGSTSYNGFGYYKTETNGTITYSGNPTPMVAGSIYTVKRAVKADGTKDYVYTQLTEKKIVSGSTKYEAVPSITKITTSGNTSTVKAVKVQSTGYYYCLSDDGKAVQQVSDFTDYREMFRCASTPWFVSEIKGEGNHIELKKLFRFHTISDGNTANSLYKVSIANVRPDDGLFDVQVRSFDDTDANPVVLESHKNLTMVPGSTRYIGYAFGTTDGEYEVRSKYVMVEVINNDMTEACVPCGFLGYPIRDYGTSLVAPSFAYNKTYYDDIREKRQYFGLSSDLMGVDVDMLTYKGVNAYTENYLKGYTQGFHLDSRLNETYSSAYTITLDNKFMSSGTTNAVWMDGVAPENVDDQHPYAPVISSESDIEGTIYETLSLRKFTAYFYGGFDGWDPYRGARTTADEYKANKYKGRISNSYGKTFYKLTGKELYPLALSGNCISSDYYAYLAAANQFEIPEKYLINLFATPGIDYVNDTFLSTEILDMIEDKRKDSLYIMTTPDKPFGASDTVDDMYSSLDVADNLVGTDIDTYYAATYYPWTKYYDSDNKKYIFLSPTKDVLRNLANVDNKKYPWYAPAGMERGDVDCVKMRFFAKLEDEDNVYDGRINPLKSFFSDGVKIWGNKTMYTGDTPMNRVNVVRLVLYMRKLVNEASRSLIFDPNDTTLKTQFESLIKPILTQIKEDRGITDFKVVTSQTAEQMDAHELSARIWVKPTPALEYIELEFMVTPQGVSFGD